jgi:hypothetical protein
VLTSTEEEPPPPPPETVPQDRFVPSVVKYFPLLLVCDGIIKTLEPSTFKYPDISIFLLMYIKQMKHLQHLL